VSIGVELCPPIGVCVSGKVANEVEKKLGFGFEPMGEQKVKNISEPIPVYRVKLDGAPAPRRRASPKSHLPGWVMPLIAAAVLAIGGATSGIWPWLMR
jgi:adenylate cyclase